MAVKGKITEVKFSMINDLNKFEEDLCIEIKKLLNESFSNISVNENITLCELKEVPVNLLYDSSEEVSNAKEFIERIEQYLSTRDDIEILLDKKHSLEIKLKLMLKKAETKEMESEPKKQEEPIVEFHPVKPRYNFSQIILDEKIMKEITDAVKILECKDLIYNKWGFSEVDSIPRSIMNFYGEPGTGKTMTAHAIANRLGKPILALNYSEIESKYVGEAPKNLQKAFDAAKQTDSVLFFDEADSFLGKRIENVTQGSDQALNSLRSQMLILLEEFSGVVLFATNLVTNFDPAFESRILRHIKFELPNKEARAAIIKKMIPSRLPVLEPFTDEQYNEASELIEGFSGREIKGAILDLLTSKADVNNPNIVFTIDDLYNSLSKKKKEKIALKSEEENRIKNKIAKKLKEKAAEADALKAIEKNENSEKNENEDSAECKPEEVTKEAVQS